MPVVRSRGFTLIELMVTIAVLAILVAIGYPSFQGVLRSNRVAAANNELIALLNLSRSEAIRNGQGGGICGSSNGSSCDGNWSGGVMAWSDTNGNGGFDAGETVLRYSTGNPSLVVQGPTSGTVIAFDARGRRRAAADQQVTLRPDQCGSQPLRRSLTVNASGQIRSKKETCV
ncbi:pre-pilin like leader sequence [Xanthomonas citri pv. fuscans]|uniref:Type II secretion system protein H n=2 Tax=Xanthomonas citri TaxID=346 RepID=A0AB33CW47_XANCI|nr:MULTISPECIES: Tfp pilus assembly protein FimT/FimU [Xanthomonas]MBV6780849.1 Tfp pilus assembly protein FimT/FimU [Xanthomonas campestris pv. trichodesmae]AMV00841.1 pre-pilin like leader sequence [Xanthomonas citri pv. aurantifolii]AMV05223.1 pre-pilin like leader sequence [Xanthomonas citri pv. aurantifolii]ASK94393.1 pre-pilin like leader sequence [Xanthomonas citri pv. vignicola]ATS65806.1 Tfp pilus assembly protein FimT/FimU [Xanthomonas citri pv. phaseoli var. fuscans]